MRGGQGFNPGSKGFPQLREGEGAETRSQGNPVFPGTAEDGGASRIPIEGDEEGVIRPEPLFQDGEEDLGDFAPGSGDGQALIQLGDQLQPPMAHPRLGGSSLRKLGRRVGGGAREGICRVELEASG
jgi:hypothetical protein